jgi:Flp pilus assembly protein TadD
MRYSILPFAICLGMAAPASAQDFFQRYQTGREQVDRGEFEAAVASLNAALAGLQPGQAPDPNIYVALGYAQMRLGRFEEASATFNMAEQSNLTPTSRQQLQANKAVLEQLRGH